MIPGRPRECARAARNDGGGMKVALRSCCATLALGAVALAATVLAARTVRPRAQSHR